MFVENREWTTAIALASSGDCRSTKNFGNCDSDNSNGCEAALDSPSQCGQCGRICSTLNGIAPATVIAGSAMFPRDRVIVALKKYSLPYKDSQTDDELRNTLAEFYAQRTITKRPILPIDNANAICWLAGDQSAKTTGHVIPVDGGLPEAFLR